LSGTGYHRRPGSVSDGELFPGSSVGALFFVVPFLVSTVGGSLIAWGLYHTPVVGFLQDRLGQRSK